MRFRGINHVNFMPDKGEPMIHTLRSLFKKDSPSPSYPERPELKEGGESNISGIFLVGDVAGKPLIKVGLNEGHELAERLFKKLQHPEPGPWDYDVIVVGCGVAGAAAGVRLHELGARVLILESGRTFQTLRTFTRGKIMLAEPANLGVKGPWSFRESPVEETLRSLTETLEKSGVHVLEFTQVTDVREEGHGFRVITGQGEYTGARVVLSTGKAGHPRSANVPGENEHREKIRYFLMDPADFSDKDILIYGGGDVAAEAALALCDTNRVTLATVDRDLIFPKKKNVEALRRKESEGKLGILTNTALVAIGEKDVTLKNGETSETTTLPNQAVFEMIGADLPREFFRKIGLRFENQWSMKKSLVLLFTLSLCLGIYTWKKGYYPFHYYGEGLGGFSGILKNPSFWYSAVYTLLLTVCGFFAMKRWSRNGTDRHQIYRFSSLIACQVVSFVVIECLFAIYLPGDTWWRAYAVTNPFPLLFDSFYNLSGVKPQELKAAIAILGFLVTFVVIPLFVRNHGKRFCSWICGCGGLAETLGDPWRHCSPKGERSRRWEFMGSVVLLWAFISALVILVFYDGNTANSGLWHASYAVIADFWLIAVIPMALYPLMGGKIWCRYWCPLAKYMEYLSRWYGRLTIVANDRCIQCTQCSLYCQVGVDVMAFAKNGEPFSNKTTSCIHCGICISVCPVDVLSFEKR